MTAAVRADVAGVRCAALTMTMTMIASGLIAGAFAADTTGNDVVSGATIEKALTRALERPPERVKTRGIRVHRVLPSRGLSWI